MYQKGVRTLARQIEHRGFMEFADIHAMLPVICHCVSPPCRFKTINDGVKYQCMDVRRDELHAGDEDVITRCVQRVRPGPALQELQTRKLRVEILRSHAAVLDIEEQTSATHCVPLPSHGRSDGYSDCC